MGWVRWLAAGGAGLAGRRVGGALATSPSPLRERFAVDPEWHRHEDGEAPRLDTHTTIAVTRVGRWEDVDPLVVADRRPWKALGLVAWGAAVGAAWWLGSSRGIGPLAGLHDRDVW